MTYFYIFDRYGTRDEEEYNTLDEALERVWGDLEFENAWPVAIFEDLGLIADNKDGVPWKPETCNLNQMCRAWHDRQEATDDER